MIFKFVFAVILSLLPAVPWLFPFRQTGYDRAERTLMPRVLQFCRNLIHRFDRTEMAKFDAATDPADIDRYQIWLTKTLVWISVVLVVGVLSVALVFLLKTR